MKFNKVNGWIIAILAVISSAALLTGCQLTQNGQTLPNPYYLVDDIQYHPSGNEFQYQKEVNMINKENAERQLSQQGNINQ